MLNDWDPGEERLADGFVEMLTAPDWATDPKRFYRIVWD